MCPDVSGIGWTSHLPDADLDFGIEPVTALNMFFFRAVRLRALQDARHAFGSTYAKESQLTDADWTKRVERWNGERRGGIPRDGQGYRVRHRWLLFSTRVIGTVPISSACGRLEHIISGVSVVYW